mmetsp:Transcript_34047/g.73717  ORF Transcript_34047/g.73717 Transcript_34047/m.73717 type:complete len:254 (+) Transcript_34047:135-896(+)
MAERRAAAPAAVEVRPPAADVPVREVEPEVLLRAAGRASPVARPARDGPLAEDLDQGRRVLGLLELLAPLGDHRLGVAVLVLDDSLDALRHGERNVDTVPSWRESDLHLLRQQQEREVLLHVVLLLVQLEPVRGAKGELRDGVALGGLAALRLRFHLALPYAQEHALALRKREGLLRVSHPGLQRDQHPSLAALLALPDRHAEGVAVGVGTLIFPHRVRLAGSLHVPFLHPLAQQLFRHRATTGPDLTRSDLI